MSKPKPTVNTEIIPYLFYRDVPAALDWVARAFGFSEELRHPTEGGMHAQMTLDRQRIMTPGVDLGLQLWNVNRRRQPSQPKPDPNPN